MKLWNFFQDKSVILLGNPAKCSDLVNHISQEDAIWLDNDGTFPILSLITLANWLWKKNNWKRD